MDGKRHGLILLDVPPDIDEHFDVSFLERSGHPVEVCRGPQDRPCPLLGGLGCPKFESAHGIVFELDLDRAEHREILQRYQAAASAGRPIRVVVGPGQAERYPDVLAGVEIWTHQPTVAELDGFAARVEATDR